MRLTAVVLAAAFVASGQGARAQADSMKKLSWLAGTWTCTNGSLVRYALQPGKSVLSQTTTALNSQDSTPATFAFDLDQLVYSEFLRDDPYLRALPDSEKLERIIMQLTAEESDVTAKRLQVQGESIVGEAMVGFRFAIERTGSDSFRHDLWVRVNNGSWSGPKSYLCRRGGAHAAQAAQPSPATGPSPGEPLAQQRSECAGLLASASFAEARMPCKRFTFTLDAALYPTQTAMRKVADPERLVPVAAGLSDANCLAAQAYFGANDIVDGEYFATNCAGWTYGLIRTLQTVDAQMKAPQHVAAMNDAQARIKLVEPMYPQIFARLRPQVSAAPVSPAP